MINVIKAKEGYVFTKRDKSEVYDTVIYLGKYDRADNYIQITKDEAIQIEKQIEEAHRKEHEASK